MPRIRQYPVADRRRPASTAAHTRRPAGPLQLGKGLAIGVLVIGVLSAGCGAGKEEPETLPSQTMTRVTPQLEAPPPPPPIRQLPPTKPQTVKVIDPGGGEGSGGQISLVEASRIAKAAKARSSEPIAEINDDNLSEYAEGGDLIIMAEVSAVPSPESPPPAAAAATGDPASIAADAEAASLGPLLPSAEAPGGVRDERYWRNRALELRMGWRRTIDQLEGLELEAAALRQQFYAEENPYVRDSQIKPAWDRILDRLDLLRDRSLRYEQELDLFVEEGRRSNAEQGWLNEGWELEPEEEEKERLEKFSAHQPIDVQTLEDDDRP